MLKFVIYVFVLHLLCQNVSLDQSLSDNVDRVQEIMEVLNVSIHQTNQEIHQTKAQMEQIEQENSRMKSEIAELKEGRDQFQEHTNSSVDVLRGMLQHVMIEGRQKQQQISNLQSEVSSLKTDVSSLQSKVSSLKSKVSRRVYFSTYLTRDFYPRDNQIVPFNNKIVDSGNNFDINTSKFRCPLTGNYFFTMNIYNNGIGDGKSKSQTSVVLIVEGRRKAKLYAHISGGQVYLELTNSVIIPCRVGQHVWVAARWGNSHLYGGSDRETTFSGFLLD